MKQRMTMLALGRGSDRVDQAWSKSGSITQIVRYENASPSGKRFGKRTAGIAVDSFILAVKARILVGRAGSFLCANPWIAVSLRAVGLSKFAVTGLYAVPGTRSWKLLRRALGNAPVVTTAEVEAEQWNAAGGSALSVLYGNTFGYPRARHESNIPTIFVGGTSDRDSEALANLVAEVQQDRAPVRLLVADGSGPRRWKGSNAEVIFYERVTSEEFGHIMSRADVVFLPILNKARASGHMVCVGALECGLPVMTTPCQGMDGYVDGRFVTYVRVQHSILEQLLHVATNHGATDEVADFWQRTFSLDAYVGRVTSAVKTLRER